VPSAGVQSSSRGWWPGEKMSDVFLIVSLVHRYPASQGGNEGIFRYFRTEMQ
jgi:hypothetical protein